MTWTTQARCGGNIHFTNYPADLTAQYCAGCPVMATCRAAGMMPHQYDPDSTHVGVRKKRRYRLTLPEKNAKRIADVRSALDGGDPGWKIAQRFGIQPNSLRWWLQKHQEMELAAQIREQAA